MQISCQRDGIFSSKMFKHCHILLHFIVSRIFKNKQEKYSGWFFLFSHLISFSIIVLQQEANTSTPNHLRPTILLRACTSNSPGLGPKSSVHKGGRICGYSTPQVEWRWLTLELLCTYAHLITTNIMSASRPWSNRNNDRSRRRSCCIHLDIRARCAARV